MEKSKSTDEKKKHSKKEVYFKQLRNAKSREQFFCFVLNFRAENDTNDGRWSCHAITPSDNNNTWWWIVRFSSSSALLTSLSPSQIASSIITVRERRSISKVSLGSFSSGENGSHIVHLFNFRSERREIIEKNAEILSVCSSSSSSSCYLSALVEIQQKWKEIAFEMAYHLLSLCRAYLSFKLYSRSSPTKSASPLLFSPFFTVCRVSCDSAQKEEEILILMTTMIFFFLSYNCLSVAVEWRQQSELSSDV